MYNFSIPIEFARPLRFLQPVHDCHQDSTASNRAQTRTSRIVLVESSAASKSCSNSIAARSLAAVCRRRMLVMNPKGPACPTFYQATTLSDVHSRPLS